MPPEQAATWLSFILGPFGTTVVLAGLVWALYTERLTPGTVTRRMREERDAALRLARTGVSVTGRAVGLADTADRKKE